MVPSQEVIMKLTHNKKISGCLQYVAGMSYLHKKGLGMCFLPTRYLSSKYTFPQNFYIEVVCAQCKGSIHVFAGNGKVLAYFPGYFILVLHNIKKIEEG